MVLLDRMGWTHPRDLSSEHSRWQGRHPIYVYDISEFVIYVFILPFILTLIICRRYRIFKTGKAAKVLYQIIWHIALWLLIVLPTGIIGLDVLGWSFVIGGLIIVIYAYPKIKL